MSAVSFTGWMLTAGGVVLAPMALLTEGVPAHLTSTNLLGFGYIAIFGGAVSYFAWMRGIATLPAASVSFLVLVNPVVAATLGWVGLGQSLSPLQLLGMGVAFSAMIVGQRVTGRPRIPVAESRATIPAPTGRMARWQPSTGSPRQEISSSLLVVACPPD